MISSAGQLGTGALSRTGDIPNAATAEVRLPEERSNSRMLRFAEIGSRSTQVALKPAGEFGSTAAGTISIPTFRPEGFKRVAEAVWYHQQQIDVARIDMLGSVESRDEDWFTGSFALKASIRPPGALNISVHPHCRRTDVAERMTASPPPYVSMIWALVEAQQLQKARALLQLVHDSPESTKLKRLLSVPIAKPSQRKDFDRTPEYRWLAENAKNYVGKWVAVSGDSLIAAANTLKDLREKIKNTTLARSPLLHYVE